MDINYAIKKTEQEFPCVFTNANKMNYGIIFYNEENKDSHDSNHAVIYPEKIKNSKAVISEIRDFYLSKDIVPRINQLFEDGYFEANYNVFKECGFNVEVNAKDKYFILEEKNQIQCKNSLDIKLITKWDERIAEDIFYPDDNTYTPPVIQKSLNNKQNYCFVGYINEKAVSTASIYVSPYGIARLDNVETALNQRSKGYSREVVNCLIEFHNKYIKTPFYLWPANKTAEKIYYEAGFRYLFESEAACAVYSKI